tara:strand:+ start:68 stop:478 length:411 start_codon:yes stop_codon:yes gene_type:complete
MAKLPPKPMNIVHEYFPIGSESPMNYVVGPKQVDESDSPEEVANQIASAEKESQVKTPATYKAVRTVASGRLKGKKKSDEKKKMHISADLSNLSKDQKKTVVQSGRKDKGGYNTKGSADLAASGLRASNELKNRRI